MQVFNVNLCVNKLSDVQGFLLYGLIFFCILPYRYIAVKNLQDRVQCQSYPISF